jgi:asparagine synthase (glutamine-hydrolysing)
VKTYSIGFADEPRYDESARARAVAQRFDTEHNEVMLTFADVLAALPDMLSHVGEPFGDASLIPTALVCREARREVTVALSGDAGDELFAGYWRYVGHHYLHKYRLLPAAVRNWLVEPLLARLPVGKGGVLSNRTRQMRKMLRADSDDALVRHLAWAQILAPEAADLFARDEERAASADLLLSVYRAAADGSAEDAGESDPLRRILRADLRVGLVGDMLHKVDIASMRHSLEVRVPLLDVNVVEYVSGLPSSYKLAGTATKRLLRDAYRDVLPAEVLERAKMGFELPIGEFLRGPLREIFHDVVRRETLESVGPLNHTAVTRLYDDHVNRRGEHADILYAVMGLCWWARHRRTTPG